MRYLSIVVLVGLLVSCNQTNAPDYQRDEQTDLFLNKTSNPSIILTPQMHRLQESSTQPPTEYFLPVGGELLNPKEFKLRPTFSLPEGRLRESLVIVASDERTSSIKDELQIRYVTWEGEISELASIRVIEDPKLDNPVLGAFPIGYGSSKLLINLMDFVDSQELYVFDLETEDEIAIRHDCETLLIPSIDMSFLAFSCLESANRWRFILTSKQVEVHTITINSTIEEAWGYDQPLVLNENVIWFNKNNYGACASRIKDEVAECKNFDFWLGQLSSDGEWIEVREGYDLHPDRVGVLATSCLIQTGQCKAQNETDTYEIAPLGSDKFIADSTWLTDNSGLLLLVQVDTDKSNQSAELSEVWLYRLESRTVEKLYDLPGAFEFGEPRFKRSPAPWSPDGNSVIVKEGQRISKLNIETGELTLLAEGGIVLGTITLP